MKTLLLTIGLGLVAALLAQDPLDLDSDLSDMRPEEADCLRSLTGLWYVKAVVDSKGRPAAQSRRKVSPVMVTESIGDGLFIAFSYVEKGECSCSEIVMLLEPTEVPGQLKMGSSRWVREIEELPVKDHYTFYCEGYCGWRTFRVAKLMGRNLEVDLEAMEEFKNFAQRKGFLLKNIFIPLQTESCIPEGH